MTAVAATIGADIWRRSVDKGKKEWASEAKPPEAERSASRKERAFSRGVPNGSTRTLRPFLGDAGQKSARG